MPRARRICFNTFPILSLLLLLATVGLWMDSNWSNRGVQQEFFKEGLIVLSSSGEYKIGYAVVESVTTSKRRDSILGIGVSRISSPVFYASSTRSSFWNQYILVVPHWFLTLIFAIGPAVWLFKWNKRRKLRSNACPACGYDLTGNESGVCPECGASTMVTTTPGGGAGRKRNGADDSC